MNEQRLDSGPTGLGGDRGQKRKRAKRRLLIDILTPGGYRMTVRGDDLTVASNVLDEWQKVCDQLIGIVAQGINRDYESSPVATEREARHPNE